MKRGLLIAILLGLVVPVGCSGFVEGRLREVRTLQAEERFEASIEPLREILKREPEHAEANERLGLALLRTGRPTLAVWPLRKSAESPEHVVSAGVLLAECLLVTGNTEESLDAVARVLQTRPGDADALVLRGRARLVNHDPTEALEDADAALASDEDQLAALEVRAQALAELERFEEAETALLELSRRSLRANPEAGPRLCAARVRFLHHQREDLARAEALAVQCLQKTPADPFMVRVAVDLFAETDRPQRAIQVLHRAASNDPQNLPFQFELAERVRASGDAEAANRLLDAAIEKIASREAFRLLADYYRRGGDRGAARTALERAIAAPEGPPDAPLRFTYGDLLIDLGELDLAAALADELEEPVYRDLLRGRILLTRGDPAAAYQAFEAGVEKWPNNPGARFLAGLAAERLGDYEAAIAHYREAARADARATDARAALARIHLARGEARVALEFAWDYTRSHPGAREGYVLAAHAATLLGDSETATRAVDRLAQIPGAEALAIVERAAVVRAAQGPAEAARILEASDLDLSAAENEAALRAVVGDLLATGEADAALARVAAAVDANGGPYTHDLRARALDQSGADPTRVAAEFERALEIDSDYAPALEGLAALAGREGNFEGALALYDRAAAADPSEPGFAYSAIQILIATHRADEAIERLRTLVRERPGSASANNDLAWLLAERGVELDRALELALRARSFDRGANTLDTLGWVHFQRGEYEPAVERLSEAVRLSPEDPAIRYRLGKARLAMGDRAGAQESFESALALGDFPDAAAARRALATLEP